MSGILLQLLRGKAHFKHFIAAPVYNDFYTANKNLPELEEFMRGAKQAFVYVNQSLVRDDKIQHMQPCFTTALWQDIIKLGSHFEQEREKHGEDYTLDFGEVDPYLSEVIYSEDDRKLFVEVEYFSQYKFRFEKQENQEEEHFRYNTVMFELCADDPDPEFKIARSS